jgi:hypothetical protein
MGPGPAHATEWGCPPDLVVPWEQPHQASAAPVLLGLAVQLLDLH